MFVLVYRYKLQREASHFGMAGHISSNYTHTHPVGHYMPLRAGEGV